MNEAPPSVPRPPCPFEVVAPTPFYSPGGCSARILGEIEGVMETHAPPPVYTYGSGENVPGIRTIRSGPRIEGFRAGFHWSRPVYDALVTRAVLARRDRHRSLHVHLHEGGLIGRVAEKLRGLPYVIDLQGSLVEETFRYAASGRAGTLRAVLTRVERLAEGGAGYIVVSSPTMVEQVRRRLPRLRDRVICIDDGIPARLILRESDRPALRRGARSAVGDPDDAFVVAYVGSLSPAQGVDRLLASVPRIRRAVPSARFRIYGAPYPGFTLDAYRESARRFGAEADVRIMGPVPYDRVTETLAGADVAVSWKSNPFEANGKIAVYMGAGVPTVALRSPIVERYLGPQGEKGGIVAADLDSAIEGVVGLAHDPDLRARLGATALRTARSELSWSSRSLKLLGLHERLRNA